MTRLQKRLLVATVSVAVLAAGGGWLIGSAWIGGTRAALETRIATYTSFLKTVRSEREERPALDEALAVSFDRMLGRDIERVDSALRTNIAALATSFGLEPSVQTTGTTVRESPAKRAFKRSASQRAFRDEPDFVEVRASVSTEGGIEAIVGFIHALDAAPWLKRIESVRLDPQPRTSTLRLSARLITIFVPNRGGLNESLPPFARFPLDRYAVLSERNPFARPVEDAEVPVVPEVPVEVVVAPIGPRAQWRLTGVVIGPEGEEVFLANATLGQTLEVRLGDAFDGITFTQASGDIATFSLDGGTFRVLVGSRLDEAAP